MSNKFNISVTDIGFSIMKTTKHVIIGWLYFAIHTLVIYSFVFVMYYFLRKNIRVEYFVLFSVLFFVVFYFINKKHLKTRTVKIDKTVNGYRFEDGAIYAMDVKKTFVLY